jgi:hypothetical protein
MRKIIKRDVERRSMQDSSERWSAAGEENVIATNEREEKRSG